MEVAVKWLYDRHGQNETALAIKGRKWINCIVHDSPVRAYSVPISEWRKMRAVIKNGKPYSVEECARHFMESGAVKGITQGAKRLLEAVLSGKQVPEEDVDVRPSENQTEQSTRKKRCRDESPDAADAEKRKSSKPANVGVTARGNLVASISAELKLEPRIARKLLRAAGLHQPYTDEKAIRGALTKQ